MIGLISFNTYAHDHHDHLEEWNNLSQEERDEMIEDALYKSLDPKMIRLFEDNNIPLSEYMEHPVWVDDYGNYSLSNPDENISQSMEIKRFFLNTFNNARLYYNTSHQRVEVCIDRDLRSCSFRPFRNDRGDFFVRDIETNNYGTNVFTVEIDRNNFYIEAKNLLANFDLFGFYEMPSRYRSENIDQIMHFLNGLNNHSYNVEINNLRTCHHNNNRIISTRYCDFNNSENINSGSTITVNRSDQEMVYVTYNNLRYSIDIDEFIRLNLRNVILRKTY